MPLRDMPESRYREASPRPELVPPPAEPTVALTAHQPLFPLPEPAALSPEPVAAPASSRTAPAVPKSAPAPADPDSRPGRSFALVWGAVIGFVLLGFAGLFAWQMGWFRASSKGAAQGGDPGPGPIPKTPPTVSDDASKVPEPMRPAYEKALAGDPNAMLFIATCYTQGLYVSRDPQEGLKWYRRAAAAGNATAQRDLRSLEAQGIR
jgi:TPR repeat protein